MCFYNIFTFDCGCESHPPTFQFPCPPARAGQRCLYPDFDHSPPPYGCHYFTVNHERKTSGKCASHRLQAQLERKVRELKDEIKHLKDDVAEQQDKIDREKEARRARNQSRLGSCCRAHGAHCEHGWRCGLK